ncbi:hypothetical protein B9J78_05810 [bacterium Unc6]|nr:hypothetical protein [bacterium Unc6]
MENKFFTKDILAIKFIFLIWGTGVLLVALFSYRDLFSYLFFEPILTVLTGCVFFIAFACFGHYIVFLFIKEDDIFLKWISSIAIGMGIYSTYVFLVGSLFTLNNQILIMPLLVMLVVGRKSLKLLLSSILAFFKRKNEILRELSLFEYFLLGCIFFSIIFSITSAFVPEISYDSLNYHLAAPKIWLRHGRIYPFPENVYTYFPFGMGMLYLSGLAAGGVSLAKIFNVFTGILLLFAIYQMGKRWGGRTSGLICASIFYVSGEIFLNTAQTFVDVGLALYTFLAVSILIENISKNALDLKKVILAGIIAGFACSIKYPAVLFVALLGGILIFFQKAVFFKKILLFAVFEICILIVFCPWLIRNIIATGNPVFPLLHNVFGILSEQGRVWDGHLVERFNYAHRVGGIGLDMFRVIIERLLGSGIGESALYFILLPLGIFWAVCDRKARMFVLWISAYCFFWALATHRIDRFFLPVLPSMALVLGSSIGTIVEFKKTLLLYPEMLFKIGSKVLRGFIVVILLKNLVVMSFLWASFEPLAILFGKENYSDYLSRILPAYPIYNAINLLPQDSKVLFFGDAQTFYIDRDVLSSSVFNRNPMEKIISQSSSASQVADKIKEQGITHIYINFSEINRLSRGYGYLNDFNFPLFQSFMTEYLEPVFTDKKGAMVLYKVK